MINRWVIPDIHGHLNTLKSLIETRINLSRLDSVYFLGDYIDRGPDSKGVLDYIMNLQKENYDIHCLKGNHEDICVKSWEADRKQSILGNILRLLGFYKSRSIIENNWRDNGGNATLSSFGVKRPGDIENRYIEWMNQTKYYIELDNHILVHAGLNFNIDNPFEDIASMLGTRVFKVERDKIKNKQVIHGHTSTKIFRIICDIESDTCDSFSLDNGVHMKNRDSYGNLLAYNLDTKELIIQPNID